MIREAKLPDGSTLKVPGIVPKLSATPGDFVGGGPRLGEHTDDVLAALGLSPDAIAALKEAGVAG
jgi:formyl-CoA transferase